MLGRCLPAVLLLSACATVSYTPLGRYVLSTELLVRSSAYDLYGAIEELRPTWLESCTIVFMNGREYGGVEALHEFTAADIDRVQLIPKGHPRPGAGVSECSAIEITDAS